MAHPDHWLINLAGLSESNFINCVSIKILQTKYKDKFLIKDTRSQHNTTRGWHLGVHLGIFFDSHLRLWFVCCPWQPLMGDSLVVSMPFSDISPYFWKVARLHTEPCAPVWHAHWVALTMSSVTTRTMLEWDFFFSQKRTLLIDWNQC